MKNYIYVKKNDEEKNNVIFPYFSDIEVAMPAEAAQPGGGEEYPTGADTTHPTPASASETGIHALNHALNPITISISTSTTDQERKERRVRSTWR